MTDLPIDWLGIGVFVGIPVYNLLTDGMRGLTVREEAFFQHIVSHAPWVIHGRFRWIFSFIWTIALIFGGVAAYLFWHDADTSTALYSVALAFHWVAFAMIVAWMRVFFTNRLMGLGLLMSVVLFCSVVVFFSIALYLAVGRAWGLYIPALIVACYGMLNTFYVWYSVPPMKEKVDADQDKMEAGQLEDRPLPPLPNNQRIAQASFSAVAAPMYGAAYQTGAATVVQRQPPQQQMQYQPQAIPMLHVPGTLAKGN